MIRSTTAGLLAFFAGLAILLQVPTLSAEAALVAGQIALVGAGLVAGIAGICLLIPPGIALSDFINEQIEDAKKPRAEREPLPGLTHAQSEHVRKGWPL